MTDILDHRDDFIRSVAKGRSFLEVGGLWGEVNEKATVAFAAGATGIGALDIWRADSEWWERFRQRCAGAGLPPVREVIGSIDNPAVVDEIGVYDVVHCAGVIYHCPNPFLTISHLRRMCGEYLLLTTAVMPPVIENEHGRLELGPDQAILVPTISDRHRRIADTYMTAAYGGGAYGVNSPIDGWFFSGGEPNYGPWWWLWTAEYMQRLLSVCGFEVVRTASQYNGTGHLYMLRKIPIGIENYGSY
jgi:hypothetical protein